MANPVNAVTEESGSRYYLHPTTGERFISVTTALDVIAKFGLQDWAAGLAADWAIDNARWLAQVATDGLVDCHDREGCGSCRTCARRTMVGRHSRVRDDAADLGSRLHEAAEHHVLFGAGAEVDDDVKPLLDQYTRWVEAWKPEIVATEATVISRAYGYAGTLDAIVKLTQLDLLPKDFHPLAGLNLVADTKTGKHIELKHGWQVAAYANAEAILLPDGTEEPLPEIGGGLILHTRADKFQVRRVDTGLDTFQFFINTLRVAEGLGASLNSVISRPFTLKETAHAGA